MAKLVCFFSGWFEIDTNDVLLRNLDTDIVQTAQQWIESSKEPLDLTNGFILESFNDANAAATDGLFEELTLEIQDN
jgi:hypothetical protein